MSTDRGQMYRWETLPWLNIEADVFKLQGRIYQASACGDSKKVRSLQKLLLNNRAAKLLAVRRVTQDNRGKNTAGVDGISSLTSEESLLLADDLRVGVKASPVRRVYIPKSGSDELRPLGIPIVRAYCTPYQEPWGWSSCRWPGATAVGRSLGGSHGCRPPAYFATVTSTTDSASGAASASASVR
jgi:hypothetical protein